MVSMHDAPDKASAVDTWHMPSGFVLRSTGFAFDLLEKLRFTHSYHLAITIVQAETHVTLLQHTFAHDIFPQLCDEETAAARDRDTFRMWYALAKRIRLGQLVDPTLIERIHNGHDRPDLATWLHLWNNTVDEIMHLRADSEVCLANELAAQRATLHDIVVTSRFQEALWLSNPGVYETGWHYYGRHWDTRTRPSKIKHLERRFYTYLQRFCAKNDTTSFFGPLNYGTCGEQETTAYLRTAETLRDRRVFLAYWAVEALAKCIVSDSAIHPYLAPRHHPARRRLSEDHNNMEDIVYTCSDGERRVIEIAVYLQRPLEEILPIVEALASQGWLLLTIALPPATLSPLDVLISIVQSWPEIPQRQQWLMILEELARFCTRFASADLQERQTILASVEERFVAVVGGEARRGQGKMFQDRSLLYEECLGNIDDFHLSREHHRTIVEALDPIARLCASFSEAVWRDLRAAAEVLFDKVSPDGKLISFTTFISAWRAQFPTLPPSASADAIRHKLIDLVVPHYNEHICRLSISDLASLYTTLDHHIVFSPDILLAAANEEALANGNFSVVLGEIHHGVQPAGWMLLFADDPLAWHSAITACLPSPTEHIVPANLLFGRRMKTAPPEFPGPSVQASAFSERLHQPDLSSLFLERRNGRLCLGQANEKGGLMFYPPSYGVPEGLYAPFAAFSYPLVRTVPVQLEGHTPRIEIGNATYQRERWDLATTTIPGLPNQGASLTLLTAFTAFRQRFDMPERVFVRTPVEPKPVYIDFQNVFALEMLVHLASQSDTITFVEMWPGPNDLWLQDDNGHYCSELRTILSMKPLRTPGDPVYGHPLSSGGEGA